MKFIGIFFLMILAGSARATTTDQDNFNSRAKTLFDGGSEPTPEQLVLGWSCFYHEEGKLRLGGDYSPELRNGNAFLTDFGSKEKVGVPLKKMNGALVAEDKNSDSTSFVAFRITQTSGKSRLLIEESTNFDSWQNPAVKSKVTGFTPNLYLICLQKTTLEGNLAK